MSPTPTHDAFGLTADPSAYVPRLALESALAELANGMGRAPACAALIGEPGLGKTLLLRVLAERLSAVFECLYVPFPRLDPAELWAWVAAALGIGRRDDARAAVLERARQRAAEGQGLVLLVDDAGALPTETRNELIDACSTPGFALVMTFTGRDRMRLVGLPEYVRRIELGPPMTPAETRAYVHARLRRVDPEGVIAGRLDDARLAELHEASAGVPARLHALLDAWLRGGPPEPVPAAPQPTPSGVAVEREPFFSPREKRRNQLAVAFALAVLVAGYWRFAPQSEPRLESSAAPPERIEPPRAEAVPPAVAELSPVPAPEEIAVAPEVAEDAPLELPSPPAAEELAPPEPPPAEEVAAAPEPSAPVAAAPAVEEPAAPPPALVATALAPPPAGPRLSINAQPWAEIQLDGRPVGETPLGDLPVSPGSHVVSATLPDGRVLERQVEARSGDVYLVFP